MDVSLGKRAYIDIENFIKYIVSEGYPITAYRFQKRLIKFCNHLGSNPEKFPICRFKVLELRKYRCAVFSKNYIIAYRIAGGTVIVTRVLHVSRLKG